MITRGNTASRESNVERLSGEHSLTRQYVPSFGGVKMFFS